jgi:SDR family mycofactocin-dependent oxidoreductase
VTRVALVTGAARGIGAATVRRLAADGWSVIAVDVCANDAAIAGYSLATREELDALRDVGEVTTFVADVRDLDALMRAIESRDALDAVVAAAGVIAGGAAYWSTDIDAERAVVDVDLVGVMNAARVGVPALLRRPEPRSGRFVAVASTAAARGLPGLAAYCAAKAGVAGFVRGLAADLAGTGVTVNAVSPGSTDTAMLAESARLYGLASVDEFVLAQPVARLLSADEIANAIAWLVGETTGGITGAVLPIDGGFTA